jgi:hypothetical protein
VHRWILACVPVWVSPELARYPRVSFTCQPCQLEIPSFVFVIDKLATVFVDLPEESPSWVVAKIWKKDRASVQRLGPRP